MNKNLLFATVVSALGSFLFGFDTAVISGTTKYITEFFSLTDTTLGVTVSIALWGTVLGSIIIGKPGDLWGRRIMLLLCAATSLCFSVGKRLGRRLVYTPGVQVLGGNCDRVFFCYGADVYCRNCTGTVTGQISRSITT